LRGKDPRRRSRVTDPIRPGESISTAMVGAEVATLQGVPGGNRSGAREVLAAAIPTRE
jgi:hypothetical protein